MLEMLPKPTSNIPKSYLKSFLGIGSPIGVLKPPPIIRRSANQPTDQPTTTIRVRPFIHTFHHRNIPSYTLLMCQRRRVYWACLHEDVNVTPPSPLLYCAKATPRTDGGSSSSDSDGNSIRQNDLKPCASVDTLPLTARHDLFTAVMHPDTCDVCAADSTTTTGLSGQETTAVDDELSTSDGRANYVENAHRDVTGVSEDDMVDLDWIMSEYSLQESQGASREVMAGEEQPSGSTGEVWFPGAGAASEGDFQLYDDDEDRFVEYDMKDIGSKDGHMTPLL
ncbi:hypothetical protein F4814DRAFT_218478 [Daldinia grandis]|nr:hypothetical protein F4814DRAFT_218478 [Daldinia grandis]